MVLVCFISPHGLLILLFSSGLLFELLFYALYFLSRICLSGVDGMAEA
jgi:hypothetical protein